MYNLKVFFDNNQDSGLCSLMKDLDYLTQILDDESEQLNYNSDSELPYGVYIPNKLLKKTKTIKISNIL